MATGETVSSMPCLTNFVSEVEDGPDFIRCFNGRQPKIHEAWTFAEDGFTREVHPTARIDVSAGFIVNFSTNYLTPCWRRIPIFGRDFINGRFKWLGVPDFLRKYGPPWTLNLLAPYANWGDRGSSNSPNLGSGSGEIMSVLLSHGIGPLASLQFTTGRSLRTPAALRVIPVTISL